MDLCSVAKDELEMEGTSGQSRVKVENRSPTVTKDENVVTMLDHSWRAKSSESDWKTTTDTSIHSSPSPVGPKVPLEVLEACDGMDDMTLNSTTLSPVLHQPSKQGRGPGRGRGRGRGSGRGRGRGRRREHRTRPTNSSEDETQKNIRKPSRGQRKRTSGSSSSKSDDSDSSSRHDSSLDSETSNSSGTCSHTSCNESYSSDHSRCASSYSTSSSCDCSSSDSSSSYTSYDSTDELTKLPCVKKGRLGPKGSKKVQEQCNQS